MEYGRLRQRNLSVTITQNERSVGGLNNAKRIAFENNDVIDQSGELTKNGSPGSLATQRPTNQFASRIKGLRKPSIQLPPTYVNGLPDLSEHYKKAREQFTWFKKERKSHRNQDMLILSPQPAMHRDLHPQEGALNLFFDKIKDRTLLKDFDHQIITKSKALNARGPQKEAATHREGDAEAKNEMVPRRSKKIKEHWHGAGDQQAHSIPRLLKNDFANMNQENLDKALSQADFTNQLTSSGGQLNNTTERILFDQEGSGLQQIMNITSSSNVIDYTIVTTRSPLDPDSKKMVKVEHSNNLRKQRRSVPFEDKDKWQNNLSWTPNPLEMQTINPEVTKVTIEQETPVYRHGNRSFLPSIVMSPSQQMFSEKFGMSLKQDGVGHKYNQYQKFEQLDVDNNKLMNDINMNIKEHQEKQSRNQSKLNDNFQFQTVNKMWPLKPNEPLTIYKQRKSIQARVLQGSAWQYPASLIPAANQDDLDKFESQQLQQLNDQGFDNAALMALNEEFEQIVDQAKLRRLEREQSIVGNRIHPYAEQQAQQEFVQKKHKSRVGVKIIKMKGKNEMPDQHHVVVPMKLMTGNFNTTTITQQGHAHQITPKSTFPSFNKFQGKSTKVTMGRTLHGKDGSPTQSNGSSNHNNSPSFNSTSNRSIKKVANQGGVGAIGGTGIKLGKGQSLSPRFTPEQQFVLQMPFTNYLSRDMQRTYMQKVRDVQIRNKKKAVGKNLNSLFGHDLADKIVEKTIGEGGTLSQESSVANTQKTPISLHHVSELNATPKREESQLQHAEKRQHQPQKDLMTASEARQSQLVQTHSVLAKQDSTPPAVGDREFVQPIKDDKRKSISIKEFQGSQELSNDAKNNDGATLQSESDNQNDQKMKNFGNLINENTVTQSGVTLHNVAPTISNHPSKMDVDNSNTGFESPKSPFITNHVMTQERMQEIQLPKHLMPIRSDSHSSQRMHVTTTVLPNGSTIPCTLFVKLILDKIIESNFESQASQGQEKPNRIPIIRQYLRLAKFVKSDLSLPYTQIALPNEKIVQGLEDIIEGNQQLVCLILLKDGQIFTRNHSKLQEIALDSLQQQYIQKKEEQLQKEIQEQKRLLEKISWMQDALNEEDQGQSNLGDALDSVTRIADDHPDSEYKNSRLSDMKLHLKGKGGFIDHVIPLMDSSPGIRSQSNPDHFGMTPSVVKEGVSVDGISPQTPIRIPRAENMQGDGQQDTACKKIHSRDNQSMQNHSFDRGRNANFKVLTVKRQSPSGQQNQSQLMNSTGHTQAKPIGRQTQGTPYIDTKQMLKLNEDSAKAMMDALRKDSTLNFIQNIDIGMENDKNISIIKDNVQELAGNIINLGGHQSKTSKSKLNASSPINFQDQSIEEERFNRFKRQLAEETVMSPISSNTSPSQQSLDVKETFKVPKASCLNHRAHLTFIREELGKLKQRTQTGGYHNTSVTAFDQTRMNKIIKQPYQMRILELNQRALKDVRQGLDQFLVNDSKDELNSTMDQIQDEIVHFQQSYSTVPASNAMNSPGSTMIDGNVQSTFGLHIQNKKNKIEIQNEGPATAELEEVASRNPDGILSIQVPTIRFSSINRQGGAQGGSSGNLTTQNKVEDGAFGRERSPPSPRDSKQIMDAIQGFVKAGGAADGTNGSSNVQPLTRNSSEQKLQEKSHIPYQFHDQLGISSIGPSASALANQHAAINVRMEDPSSHDQAISGYSPSRATLFKDESQAQFNQQYYSYSKKIQQKSNKERQQVQITHQNSKLSLQAQKLFQKVDEQFC